MEREPLSSLQQRWIEYVRKQPDHSHVKELLKDDSWKLEESMALTRLDSQDTNLISVLANNLHPPSLPSSTPSNEPNFVNEATEKVRARVEALEERLHNEKLSSLRTFQSLTSANYFIPHDKFFYRTAKDSEALESNFLMLKLSFYNDERLDQRSQSFEIYADTKLTELRDRIHCPKKEIVLRSFHHGAYPPPTREEFINLADLTSDVIFPSFFLIGDRCYLDSPKEDLDLIKNLESWISLKYPNQLKERVFKMGEATWLDLPIQINRPYNYVHCGRCSHKFIVEEIRLAHPFDLADPQHDGPIREVFKARKRRRKCSICDHCRASWITLHDKMSPENPCYFCDICFSQLHYGEDGKVLYSDFLVYPYRNEL